MAIACPEYTTSISGWAAQPAVTAEALREQAAKLEKQERKAKAAAKAAKREQKAAAKRRQIALDALARVAADTSKGYAAVEAAKALLAES